MRRATRIVLDRPRVPVRLTGKTVVVTGAGSGVGRGTAAALRRTGADLVLVTRTEGDARRARAALAAVPGTGSVAALAADLGSREEVERLAVELRDRTPDLHALVHCAGLRLPERREGPDGAELMFMVELLAPLLLTVRLLEPLERGAPSRVVLVSGEHHRRRWGMPVRFDPANLQAEKAFSVGAHGAHLALARVLFTQELARRLEGSGVTVLTVAPGPAATGLYRHLPPLRRAMARIGLLLRRAQPPEAAGEHVAHAVSDPELAGTSGRYLLGDRSVVPSPAARSREAARALWTLLEGAAGEAILPENNPAP